MLDVCTVAEVSPDLHFCKLVYIFLIQGQKTEF